VIELAHAPPKLHRRLPDPASGDAAISVYDATALGYDASRDPFYAYLRERFDRILARELPPAPCSVLDLGCGTGWQAIPLLAQGYDVTAVDLSQGLLAVARSKAAALNGRAGRAVFLRNDIRALPLPSESFEVVYSLGSVLSHLADPVPALQEIHRVLARRGRAILEFENLFNLELVFMAMDAAFRGGRSYGAGLADLSEAVRGTSDLRFRIPIPVDNGETASVPLFKSTLKRRKSWLAAAGLTLVRRYGLHLATQVIPPRIQDRCSSRALHRLLALLDRVDDLVWTSGRLSRFANSVVVVVEKSG